MLTSLLFRRTNSRIETNWLWLLRKPSPRSSPAPFLDRIRRSRFLSLINMCTHWWHILAIGSFSCKWPNRGRSWIDIILVRVRIWVWSTKWKKWGKPRRERAVRRYANERRTLGRLREYRNQGTNWFYIQNLRFIDWIRMNSISTHHSFHSNKNQVFQPQNLCTNPKAPMWTKITEVLVLRTFFFKTMKNPYKCPPSWLVYALNKAPMRTKITQRWALWKFEPKILPPFFLFKTSKNPLQFFTCLCTKPQKLQKDKPFEPQISPILFKTRKYPLHFSPFLTCLSTKPNSYVNQENFPFFFPSKPGNTHFSCTESMSYVEKKYYRKKKRNQIFKIEYFLKTRKIPISFFTILDLFYAKNNK